MSKNVDYDEMFGTSSGNRRTSSGTARQSRYDSDDTGITGETVEEFRNRSKRNEGFFARADSIESLTNRYSRYRPFLHRRHSDYGLMSFMGEFFDGFAVGALLAVVTWLLIPKLIPVTIAGTIGFFIGVFLKLRIHDHYSRQEALKNGIPACLIAVVIAVVIIVSFRNA